MPSRHSPLPPERWLLQRRKPPIVAAPFHVSLTAFLLEEVKRSAPLCVSHAHAYLNKFRNLATSPTPRPRWPLWRALWRSPQYSASASLAAVRIPIQAHT